MSHRGPKSKGVGGGSWHISNKFTLFITKKMLFFLEERDLKKTYSGQNSFNTGV